MTLRIGIPKESLAGERRVAAVPEVVARYVGKGLTVLVEQGAGEGARFADADFAATGAKLTDTSGAFGADIVLKAAPPTREEAALLGAGALLVGMLSPYDSHEIFDTLAQTGVNALAMELLPRISRAQAMDVLSSQANIAGYRAVIEATARYAGLMPLMMTAAGTAKPARVLVLGVGVAGLQAIATAKRLGARVEAFDVRPETRDQVHSLGAKFIDLDLGEQATGSGGYAGQLSEQAAARQQELLAECVQRADIVITTALVPGRAAPRLVTQEAVAAMKAGSVIVDMAAAAGGNCPLTQRDQVVTTDNGVILVGYTNLPSLVATHASRFYANNLRHLLELLLPESVEGGQPEIRFDLDDEIIAAALVTYEGAVRWTVPTTG